MKTAPLQAAALAFGDDGVPRSLLYGDVYHPRAGALAQARHVFLGGNQLPARWRGRARFTVLETGFGLGNNFLATWDAWRRDAAHCERLHYVGIEKHPFAAPDLARAHAASPLQPLAAELVAQWPALTPNVHALCFEGGRVQLLLAFFDVRDVLPETIANVDAFYLDGFAPAKNPAMWERRVYKALGRLAAPHASAATWSAAREVRDGLAEAGFVVEKAPGFDTKRDMTVAWFEPPFMPRRAPARLMQAAAPRHAVIVGGGLAGCASAWALAQQGITSTLFERHAQPAQEASGNAAGLFHGVVTPYDGTHARFNRAAALAAAQIVHRAVHEHGVAGAVDGLLRIESALALHDMQAIVERLGLPASYVRAVDAHEAQRLCGLPLSHAAWCYASGGWVHAAGLARAFLAMAGDAVAWRGGVEVAALRSGGPGWQLLDAQGALIAESACVVLANSAEALRLLGTPAWALQRVRGQTSALPLNTPGLVAPRLPVAGAGYVLPAIDGRVWCGATTAAGDEDAALREADHAHNLAQLARLTGSPIDAAPSALEGRVGWRLVAGDRLPVIGAAPDTNAAALPDVRLDQPRFVPRLPGLYVHTALASRGITWAALGAQTLAALVSGAPGPLEASLFDAVDAGRFASRAARRGA